MASISSDGVQRLQDMQLISMGEVNLRVLHTPGHAADHAVFLAEGTGAMFTGRRGARAGDGDHRPGRGRPGAVPPVAPPDAGGAAARDLPGPRADGVDAVGKITEYEEHRAMREQQALDALATGPHLIAELVGGDLRGRSGRARTRPQRCSSRR